MAVEYAWNRRKIELADLLELAIEKALTENERKIISQFYYENLTVTEIAAFSEKSYNAVKKSLKTAEKKLFEKLEYAAMYIHNLENPELSEEKIKEAKAISVLRKNQCVE